MVKQLGLLEPWFVITHTIWTTQEDTVFISDRDRNGGQCSVFWSDVSRDSLIVSESQKECLSGFQKECWHSFWLSLTMRESLETSDQKTEHWPPFLSLSLIKKLCPLVLFKSCVLSRIKGSSNPNCLNFLKDAYKVYQGVPPTYWHGAQMIYTARGTHTARATVHADSLWQCPITSKCSQKFISNFQASIFHSINAEQNMFSVSGLSCHNSSFLSLKTSTFFFEQNWCWCWGRRKFDMQISVILNRKENHHFWLCESLHCCDINFIL